MKNLYGEEGEIFLDKIENDKDMFVDMEKKDKRQENLIQLEHNEEQ